MLPAFASHRGTYKQGGSAQAFDQRAIDREVIARQSLFTLGCASTAAKEFGRDVAFQQLVAVLREKQIGGTNSMTLLGKRRGRGGIAQRWHYRERIAVENSATRC
jgi:hypothetical protein